MIELLVVILFLSLIYWAVHQLAGAFGLPAPVVVVVDVILVIAFVLYILKFFGVATPAFV